MSHYARVNHVTRIPQDHAIVEIESEPVPTSADRGTCTHLLLYGTLLSWRLDGSRINREQRQSFRTPDEFWSLLGALTRPKSRLCVWSYSAGYHLTTLGFWGRLDSRQFSLRENGALPSHEGTKSSRRRRGGGMFVVGDPPVVIDCIDTNGRSYRFLDVLNWTARDSAELAQLVGLDLPARPGETALVGDWMPFVDASALVYSECVKRIVTLVREADLGNFQPTQAGQSHSFYCHSHMKVKHVAGDDPATRPMEREAYIGARCVVYFRGQALLPMDDLAADDRRLDPHLPWSLCGPIYHLDVNQCYPFVMQAHRFPFVCRESLNAPRLIDLLDRIGEDVVVARVKIDSPDEPWPKRVEGRVEWRIGKFDTTLVGVELVRALTTGLVLKCYEAQVYSSAYLFRSYVKACTLGRAKAVAAGDGFTASLWKGLAASLHGRFGQKGRRWEADPAEHATMDWGQYVEEGEEKDTMILYRGVAGYRQRYIEDDSAPHSVPVLAAAITAAAREHVRSARIAAGYRGCVYEDADSLHVTQDGLDRLSAAGWLDDERPGALKLKPERGRACYWGKKNYLLGDRRVCSGRMATAVQVAKGVWKQTHFRRIESLIGSYPPAGAQSVEVDLEEPAVREDCAYGKDGWLTWLIGGDTIDPCTAK